MKNDLASMWSLLSGPWTEVDSRDALWKQELSNTWTWSLFAGPDSLCWLPSIQYLPQDVNKTQGITKLNITTCSLPDMDRSNRALNARHQKNQQALKRNKRKCRWRVFNNIFTVKAEGKQSVASAPHPLPSNSLPYLCNLPVNMCPVFNLRGSQRELSCRRSVSLFTWPVSTHGTVQYLFLFWDTNLPQVRGKLNK